MITALLIMLNLIIALAALPPAIFLLREVIVEGKDPIKAFRKSPINLGLRFIFTLPVVISLVNIFFALSLVFSIPLRDDHLLELGLSVGVFSLVTTWVFYYVYKKTP